MNDLARRLSFAEEHFRVVECLLQSSVPPINPWTSWALQAPFDLGLHTNARSRQSKTKRDATAAIDAPKVDPRIYETTSLETQKKILGRLSVAII